MLRKLLQSICKMRSTPFFFKEKKTIQIFLVIILIFLSVFWFYLIYSSNIEKERIVSKEKDNLIRMSEVLSTHITNIIKDLKLYISLLDLWLIQHPDADPRSDKEFVELVNHFRKKEDWPKIDLRLVSEKDELFMIPSLSKKPLANVRDREYVLAQKDPGKKGFYIAESVKSRVTKLWGIPISYPLTKKNHGISIIFGVLELRFFNEMLEKFRPQPHGSVSLFRNDSVLLTRMPFDENILGRSFSSLPLWEKYSQGIKSGTVIFKTSLTDDRDQLIAYKEIEGFPLIVSVSVDYDEILFSWHKLFFTRIIILLLITIFILFLGSRLILSLFDMAFQRTELENLNEVLNESYIALARNLKEKKLIVQEANHRMKNHMQQLISLITISSEFKEENLVEMLKARIYSFAVLYDKLSYKENLNEQIHLKQYLNSLIQELLIIYQNNKKVEFILKGSEILINAQKATTVGLIVSELVTNSIKYAFSDSRHNILKLTIQMDHDRLQLDYWDNGEGFDFHKIIADEKSNHLGFVLISTMLKQYRGKIDYRIEDGSFFTITL